MNGEEEEEEKEKWQMIGALVEGAELKVFTGQEEDMHVWLLFFLSFFNTAPISGQRPITHKHTSTHLGKAVRRSSCLPLVKP